MFDIGWSELLLIAVAALIVVGPKDLPALLRTLGRYVGMIRAHAQEFRTQFEDAINETGLEEMRNEMTELRDDVSSTMRDAGADIKRDMAETKSVLNEAGRAPDVDASSGPAHHRTQTQSITGKNLDTTDSSEHDDGARQSQKPDDKSEA